MMDSWDSVIIKTQWNVYPNVVKQRDKEVAWVITTVLLDEIADLVREQVEDVLFTSISFQLWDDVKK